VPTLADPSEMTGRQKAAILCMALGSEVAAKVTQQLTPEETEVITYEIARVDQVSPERVDRVLAEWVESVVAADVAGGGVEFAREVLEKAFGSARANQILKRIQSQLQESAGLQRLRNADPQQLVNTLRGEHPQTLALILAHLQPAQTAAILKELDPTLGSDVVVRMARMEKVSPDMLNLIERSLAAETELSMAQGLSSSGGPGAVAQVLNLVHSTLEQQLLDGVGQRDQALCDQIKNLMFVFEDISTLDDRALQRLLREVEAKVLALALKAASEELKTKIMGAMSQRAVGSLKEEMEMMGPVKMRDVEAAQLAIVTQIRQLEESGEIVISGGDDLVVG
jgi:flagellar motor switch protein FliG